MQKSNLMCPEKEKSPDFFNKIRGLPVLRLLGKLRLERLDKTSCWLPINHRPTRLSRAKF